MKVKKIKRTSQGLRDILFEEIEELRNGDGDPSKAMAVANLAKQIITRIELQGTRIIYRKDGPAWDGKPQDATIWQMPEWYKREIENG